MAFTVADMRSLCNVSNVYIVVLVSSPVDETIVVYKNASMYEKHQDTT